MESEKLGPRDHALIESMGMTIGQVNEQIKWLRDPPAPVVLERPCTLGDGILPLEPSMHKQLKAHWEQAVAEGRLMRFVPASGAASRMFKTLTQIVQTEPQELSEDQRAELDQFFRDLDAYAFRDVLARHLSERSIRLDKATDVSAQKEILVQLLSATGLDYASYPKGLLPFHRYADGDVRTAIEEHLAEVPAIVRDANGCCRLHVSVAPAALNAFRAYTLAVMPSYEERYDCSYEIEWSVQDTSTNTVALDMTDQLLRTPEGEIYFRPGGHGALLGNLSALKGDIVLIKNIDNIARDEYREDTVLWQRLMTGFLLRTQQRIFELLEALDASQDATEALSFIEERLNKPIPDWLDNDEERHSFAVACLDRPLRVCGMIKNSGEPGGGPFWVRGRQGNLSCQIVESAQVDDSDAQKQIFKSATHFNPVDIVCGLRDWKGEPFDLNQYCDRDAVFVTRKSHLGRELKALELPGLWNGGMAHWNTLFVEIPETVFQPVKEYRDWLRRKHQPPKPDGD